MSTDTSLHPEVESPQSKEMERVFQLQKNKQFELARSTVKQRKAKLSKLHDAVMRYRQEIRDALHQDYRKSAAEVDLTEIYVVTGEIKHAKRHLRSWMGPKSVSTPLAFMGASSWIHYEPKGVSLIIAPWNYPFQLAMGPLVSAIAAGCTAIIKPSEHAPHIAAVMRKIIEELFDESEVAIFEGAVETSTDLLALPFNHIFFTGSPAVGKIVMGAAAKNLSSVTLELGGKSPTIIDETANIKATIKRIMWGKFSNCGQICIAPDHVYVHESRMDEFIEAARAQLKSFYSDDVEGSADYMRMINKQHLERVLGYLEASVAQGAKIVVGGKNNPAKAFLEPTLVVNAPMDSPLMTEEIFGPVLPVQSYKNIDEVLHTINAGEKPLALYIYSGSGKRIKHIMDNTRAGGTCINNSDIHFFNNNLPFGGSNNSGIGKSHGKFGFEAFSNARSVMKQNIPGALELLMPPYTDLKMKLIDLTIKWF